MKQFSLFILLAALSGTSLLAQGKSETFITKTSTQQQQLKISVPEGNFSYKSSATAGKSFYKVNHDDFVLSHKESPISAGVLFSSFIFKNEMAARDVSMNPSEIFGSSEANANMLQFGQDPTLTTDLNVEVIKGMLRANFTGLKIVNAEIRGGNSDIMIDFTQENSVAMRQLYIHTASGKIVVRNLEFANANTTILENNMGDIRLVIGKGSAAAGECKIVASMGKCELVIDNSQPVKIIVKKSAMLTLNIPAEYQKISENVYVNPAFNVNKSGKALTITCNKDAGSLEVIPN